MKKTRFILSTALISISMLALGAIAYVSHAGNITKKDEIKENAIDTMTVQDFSSRSSSVKVANGMSSYAAIINGRVYTWGYNSNAVLGHGHNSYVERPTWVSSLGSSVTDFSFGSGNYAGAINANGLYMWGQNNHGQLGTGDKANRAYPTNVLATSGLSSLSLSTASNYIQDGRHSSVLWGVEIYTWGTGKNSRLAHHNNDDDMLTPRRTEYIRQDGWGDDDEGYRALTVRAGARHTIGVARLPNGKQGVYSFGDSNRNSSIAFSVSPWLSRDFPTTWDDEVEEGKTFSGYNVVADTYNDHNIAAIDGTVWTWGDNDAQQLGSGAGEDEQYARPRYDLGNVTLVAAGNLSNMAVSNGNLYIWGKGSPSPRHIQGGNWTQIEASHSEVGHHIGVNYNQVWMMSDTSGWPLNINDYISIELNAINDPNGYRKYVVYNLDAAELRKLINASSSRMSLPDSYSVNNQVNLGSTTVNSKTTGQTSLKAVSDSGYWFFTTFITINGFAPAENTAKADSGGYKFDAANKATTDAETFKNMGINQIVDDAQKGSNPNSPLLTWINAEFKGAVNPDNKYTTHFPKDSNITKISDVNRTVNKQDPTKWDVHFTATVDKYYKNEGANVVLSSSTDKPLKIDEEFTIKNLPIVQAEEDYIDENSNLFILGTRFTKALNPEGRSTANDETDIINADLFFQAITNNENGGKVLDRDFLEYYTKISFIPEKYYKTNLNEPQAQVPNNIYIWRNVPDKPDTDTIKYIEFALKADKYYTNYGELKSDYIKVVKFSIEQNDSGVVIKDDSNSIIGNYTTGDFIDLLMPSSKLTRSASSYKAIDKKIAAEFLDINSFPSTAVFYIKTEDPIINNHEKGEFTFTLYADRYYTKKNFKMQTGITGFGTFTVDGLKPAYDLSSHPIEPQPRFNEIRASSNFYDEIIDSTNGNVNIDQIRQYFDMRAIPDDANVSLVRLDQNDSSLIKFRMITDRYTGAGGKTIFKEKSRLFNVKLPGVDSTLIIILISAGVFLVFAIVALIITIRNKRSVASHESEIFYC